MNDVNSPYLNLDTTIYMKDQWNALQLVASTGDVSRFISLIELGANPSAQSQNKAVPQVTPLHIACRHGHMEIVKLLIGKCGINIQDQWGFTSLHYAVVARKRDIVEFLLSNGASAAIQSKAGSSPLDFAEKLKFLEVVDALRSKLKLETDPTVPKFKEWLNHLGVGEYTSKFIDAGYDLPFIARHGLSESDLDCVGIPMSKLGLRRKLVHLHDLGKFYKEEVEEEEDDDDEEEDDDEDEESDEDDDD